MALVEAKCLNCGANLKVNNQEKSGICEHCGTSYMTKDIIVNNITNIQYLEVVDGVNINRNAVLEKLLIEYYAERFTDIDNTKEYALKVLEYDFSNVLAHFVVFDNIDSVSSIRKLLRNKKLNISLDLFLVLINICGDDLNYLDIIQNIVNYQSNMEKLTIIRTVIEKYYKRDLAFILNLIYNFKLTESENDIILDELYNNSKTNKITMLSQLKLFTNKHNDFKYNQQKFDEYIDYWKKLKEKQIELRKNLEEKKSNQKQIDKINKIKKKKQNQKLYFIMMGCIIFIIMLIIIILAIK